MLVCKNGHKFPPHYEECKKCGAPEWACDVEPANPLDWIYDLETYPNIFTFLAKHPLSGQYVFFEISDRKNQTLELYEFLSALQYNKSRMIGYNNIGFDYPIIHHFMYWGMLDPQQSLDLIYSKVEKIVSTDWNDRFKNQVAPWDVLIPQVDLWVLNHLNYKTKMTSLKTLEFNMQSDNIEDLPYKPGTALNDHEKDNLIAYQYNDVDETEKFYFESHSAIIFRENMSAKYNMNFMNHDDTKIGKDFFVSKLEAKLPGACYTKIDGKRTARGTKRPYLNLKDVIFQYINFERREFQLVKEWLENKTIKETKGCFEYCEVKPEFAARMDPDLIKVHGLDCSLDPDRKGIILSKLNDHAISEHYRYVSGWKDKSGMNCIIDGFKFVFGTGGIHGSIHSDTVVSDEQGVIYDWDVASYYPNVAIKNKLYPEHLSVEFCSIYEDFYNERSQYKKGTSENQGIKLGLNAVFGHSNNPFSPFFDSKFTMGITINGQLLLCLLAENLMKIPGLKMIQINTDGLTVKCPLPYVDTMKQICAWWEQFTCLTLESAVYSRMFIRDVNNYVAEYESGGVKRKGAYEYDQAWHKDHSQLVVAKAVEAHLIKGTPVESFIYNHENIFDFMLCGKVKGADELYLGDRKLSKTTRYYISTIGEKLVKVSPPPKGHDVGQWKKKTGIKNDYYWSIIEELKKATWQVCRTDSYLDSTNLPWDERINSKNKSTYLIRRTGLNADRLVTECNDIKKADRNYIDFDYYITEAFKLINPVRGNHEKICN
jgi:(2Fe-2S) ferredoxin